MAVQYQKTADSEQHILLRKLKVIPGPEKGGDTSSGLAEDLGDALGLPILLVNQFGISDPSEGPAQPEWTYEDQTTKRFLAQLARQFAVSEEEEKFRHLHQNWVSERNEFGSLTDVFIHPSYQQIIGMGPVAIPFILRELEKELDDWFWALNAITCLDPVEDEDEGRLPAMRDSWLEWGRVNGHI